MTQRLHMVFPGNQMAVRKALKDSMQGLSHLELTQDEKSTVEMVLAEVLNNVVEHAYQDRDVGVIELDVLRVGDELKVKVLDDGLPMPNGELPCGQMHDLDACGVQDLPEGGFGWFLIREMTHELCYQRDGTRNQLSFRVALGDNCRPN